MLEPTLHEVCKGRLGPIEWFHASWQRGGAATGFATYRLHDDQPPVGVLVKLPIGPLEYKWTTRLGACADASAFTSDHAQHLPVARVLAHGMELGGYDLGWIISERLSGDHMPRHMSARDVEELLTRVCEFHRMALAHEPVTGKPHSPAWDQLLDKARHQCREHAVAEFSRWADAIRKVQRALPALANRWSARVLDTWCHGDVHPGNVLRRGEHGQLVLIDLGLVHPGHWIEDALYLERQYWGHEDWLGGVKPVSILGRLRREAGLPMDGDYGELANIRRVMMAACVPAVVDREGSNTKYLRHALDLIERLLPQIPH